jgi:hypothetical protein
MLSAAQAQNSLAQPQLRAAYSSLRLQSRVLRSQSGNGIWRGQDSGVSIVASVTYRIRRSKRLCLAKNENKSDAELEVCHSHLRIQVLTQEDITRAPTKILSPRKISKTSAFGMPMKLKACSNQRSRFLATNSHCGFGAAAVVKSRGNLKVPAVYSDHQAEGVEHAMEFEMQRFKRLT